MHISLFCPCLHVQHLLSLVGSLMDFLAETDFANRTTKDQTVVVVEDVVVVIGLITSFKVETILLVGELVAPPSPKVVERTSAVQMA